MNIKQNITIQDIVLWQTQKYGTFEVQQQKKFLTNPSKLKKNTETFNIKHKLPPRTF